MSQDCINCVVKRGVEGIGREKGVGEGPEGAEERGGRREEEVGEGKNFGQVLVIIAKLKAPFTFQISRPLPGAACEVPI